MQKLSQKTQGIVYVLIAAFGFSLMSMFVKLAGDLPSFEKAFFRNFVALIFIVILSKFAEFVKRTLFNCESIFGWSVSFNKIFV